MIFVDFIDSFIVLKNTESTICKYIINKTLPNTEEIFL